MLKSFLQKMKRQAAALMGFSMTLTLFSPVAPLTKAADTTHADQQLITAESEWTYLDDNRDPWKDSELYKMVAGTPYESALNSYRWIWSTPHKPFMVFMGGAESDMGTDDSTWKTGSNPFGYAAASTPASWESVKTSLTGNIAGTTERAQTYFFRYNFDLDDASWINTVSYQLQYNDAAILYLNGKVIGSHNTPEAGFTQNVSYGAKAPAGDFLEASASVIIEPGMLRAGSNTLAIALHQESAVGADVYLNVEDFTLSAAEVPLPPETIQLTMQPGATEAQRNFTWLSSVKEAGVLTLWTDGSTPKTYQATAAQLSKRYRFLTNKVTVSGLAAGQTYYYKVTNGNPAATGVESKTYSFKTAAATDNYSFLFAGDPQIGTSGSVTNDSLGWQNTIERSLKAWPDLNFVVSAGDQVETADTEEHYSGYLAPEALASLPVAQSVGNHDNTSNYLGHFNLPNMTTDGATAAGGDYSYTYGKTLFMHINSNNMSTASHKSFMQKTIADYKAAHNGLEPDWKILVFHHGLYTSASHTLDDDIRQRRLEWSPVISDLDIDAVLDGHDHVYTRTYMMSGTMVSGVTTGAGTAPIDDEKLYTAKNGDPYAEYSKTKAGEAVYITANSASGSKHYELTKTDYPFVAKDDQQERPTITKVDATTDSLSFRTYYTDANINVDTPIDTFTLKKPANTAPAVSGVTVTPAAAKLVKGKTLQLKAAVTVNHTTTQDVTWKLAGNQDPKSTISNTGLLTVSLNENAKVLKVTAASMADPSKTATASITLVTPVTVSKVAVTPVKVTLAAGKTQQFKASVTGTGSPAQTVVWKLSGNKDKATTISRTGLLKISAKETAKALKVTAVSTLNPTKSAAAAVTVQPLATVTSVKIAPVKTTMFAGKALQLKAKLYGTNHPSQSFTWKIAGNKDKKTTISKTGVLRVSKNEKAKKLKVRVYAAQNKAKYADALITIKPPVTGTPNRVFPTSRTVKKGSKISLKAPKNYTLYYTTNGKNPSSRAHTVKSGRTVKITIKKNTTVKLYAVKKGCSRSKVVTRSYRIR